MSTFGWTQNLNGFATSLHFESFSMAAALGPLGSIARGRAGAFFSLVCLAFSLVLLRLIGSLTTPLFLFTRIPASPPLRVVALVLCRVCPLVWCCGASDGVRSSSSSAVAASASVLHRALSFGSGVGGPSSLREPARLRRIAPRSLTVRLVHLFHYELVIS